MVLCLAVNASTVIAEIKHLAPEERAKVVRFIHELDDSRKLSGAKLSALAERMTETRDASERSVVREAIVCGFYGDDDDA
jgi:hypothetical protein